MADLNYYESEYKKESVRQSATPPIDMWEKIEASLDAKSNKKAFIWYWVAAAAGIALLFTLGLNHLTTSSSFENKIVLSNSDQEEETIESSSTPMIVHAEEETTQNQKSKTAPLMVEESTSEKEGTVHFNQNLIRKNQNGKLSRLNNNKVQLPLIAYRPDLPLFKSSKVNVSNLQTKSPKNNNWMEKYNVEDRQEDNQTYKRREPTRVQIGGSVSPSYNFRQLSQTAQNNLPSNPNSEEGIVTLAAAFDLNIKVHKNWAIESGIRYSRMGQQVHAGFYNESVFAMASGKDGNKPPKVNKISLANSMGDVSTKVQGNSNQNMVSTLDYSNTMKVVGFESTASETQAELEQRIDYLEIPITFRFYLPTSGKVKLSLAGGVSTNWLIDNNAYLTSDGNKQSLGSTNDISSMTWSSHAGVALSVPIVGQLSFKLEPRINYFLSDINSGHPIGFRPYSFGLFSGVQYSFGN